MAVPASIRSFMAVACRCAALLLALAGTVPAASAADLLDATPRAAIISAFEPELAAILARTHVERHVQANGVDFALGELGGQRVLVFASGVSMVNAAMTTQLALDRFAVTQIVMSGIAGGVDPKLNVGDVVVPERWGQYLEAVFARETPDGYKLPSWATRSFPAFGMSFPQNVTVRNADHPDGSRQFWFAVDPALLARARAAAAKLSLRDCLAPQVCLPHKPQLVVGGNGVSGQAFVDNAAFRAYVASTFDADVLDMETAAVAAVAFANTVPFIGFRSLSDLAGGSAGDNEMETFMGLASTNAAAALEGFLAER